MVRRSRTRLRRCRRRQIGRAKRLKGDDPELAAGARATWPIAAWPGADRDRVLAISAATIDRLLVDVKIAASGGRRRRAGFYSAIRREVPIRTFNDWNSPVPGFCEVDMVAHGGTSVAGSFIQTLTMVDIATGWTECLPLLTRQSSLVVEAIRRVACNPLTRGTRR